MPLLRARVVVHMHSGHFSPPLRATTEPNEARPPRTTRFYRPSHLPARTLRIGGVVAAIPDGNAPPAPGTGDLSIATTQLLPRPENDLAQEPSVAGDGAVVMYTYNWGAAYSVDGGRTFTTLDPNVIFPKEAHPHAGDGGGYCCDQVVIYDHQSDRFIWALQYPTDLRGVDFIRVAWASPRNLAAYGPGAWSWFDIPATAFQRDCPPQDHRTVCNFLDQPRLGLSHHYLFMNVNQGRFFDGKIYNTAIVRISRTAFASPHGPSGYGTAVIPGYSLRVAQHVMGPVEYFVGHDGTSRLKVASIADDSNDIQVQELAEPTIADQDWTTMTPGGDDMMARQAESQATQVTGVT